MPSHKAVFTILIMTLKLFIQALTKFLFGLLLVGVLLFLPAGTFDYWQAWLFIGILFRPMFIAVFVVAGLNFRFGWLLMPNWTTYVAAGIFLLGYALYAEVMRENVWLSRTVEVQENQQVIDTGLYGIVRHPMYSATLLLFLSMPLVLNSVWSFALMLLYIPIIVKRIRNEEEVLERDLAGYKEYKQRVRYRLIPYIW